MAEDYQGDIKGFLGLSNQESPYEQARFVVLPVPYERTTTYRKGTCGGPSAILSASYEVELFDDETLTQPYKKGISTISALRVDESEPETALEKIYRACRSLIEDNKIFCMLGGEHTISIGAVKACREKYDDLSVLQLDAHADLRDMYQNSRYSHACVMRRIREITNITVGVGIRNISKSGYDAITREKIPIITATQMFQNNDWIKQALKHLSDNVYLTIDCDFFDPGIMPGVGTPEPGGGLWYQTLAFLRELIKHKNVVSFDVVELCPLPENNISEFAAAKLIYKIMGYISLKA